MQQNRERRGAVAVGEKNITYLVLVRAHLLHLADEVYVVAASGAEAGGRGASKRRHSKRLSKSKEA